MFNKEQGKYFKRKNNTNNNNNDTNIYIYIYCNIYIYIYVRTCKSIAQAHLELAKLRSEQLAERLPVRALLV